MIVHVDTDFPEVAAKALEELVVYLESKVGEEDCALPEHVYVGEGGEIDDAPCMSYVALRPCGCMVGLASAREGLDRKWANGIADYMVMGDYIESVPVQYVRNHYGEVCSVCRPAEQLALPMEEER